jgi:arabinogalactan endo-1,4-beta-galactosidase
MAIKMIPMKLKIGMLLFLSVGIASCKKNKNIRAGAARKSSFGYRSLSGRRPFLLPEIETTATLYYNSNGQTQDALTILKNSGMNIVRLRLWHTPSNGNSGLAQVAAFAQRIKAAGLQWWLDIHYSDSWADPGQQTPPSAWQAAAYTDLLDSVYNYTYRVMSETEK